MLSNASRILSLRALYLLLGTLPGSSPSQRPFQYEWRYQGCDDHHDYNRTKRCSIDHRFIYSRRRHRHERCADAGKDQAHLATWNHSQSDRQAIYPSFKHTQRADLLTNNCDEGKHQRESQDIHASEKPEVYLKSHQDKEDRNEKGADRLEQFVQISLGSTTCWFVVDLIEDQAGGKSANDRGQSDLRRHPCQ